MSTLNQDQLDYWNRRAAGDLEGFKNRLLARFFRTGYVGFNRLRERRVVSQHLIGTRVLDVGCGDGTFMQRLMRRHRGRLFQGIDFSPAMIAVARRGGLETSVMDMCSLDFKDKSWDTAYAVRAVKNLLDRGSQGRALVEMCRISSQRVIIVDTFQGLAKKPAPHYNLPLDPDHVIGACQSGGFALVERGLFPAGPLAWGPAEEHGSGDGYLVFDRVH